MGKPNKNYVSFYRVEGKYNLLNSSDVSAQYVVTGINRDIVKEKGLCTSFLIDIDHDYEQNPEDASVLELLDELEYIYKNKYMWNSSLKDIAPLREYLESIKEEQETLSHQYNLDFAKYQIEYWTNRLEEIK